MLATPALSNPLTPKTLDDFSHWRWGLMFPNPHDQPAGVLEEGLISPVASAIRIKLGAPPLSIRLWIYRVLRTAVPKATVHKHRNHRSRKCNVRASRQSPDIHAIPESPPLQFAPQQQLRTGPGSGEPRHEAPHGRARCLRLGAPTGIGAHQ